MHLEIPYRKYKGGYFIPLIWLASSLFWLRLFIIDHETYTIVWVLVSLLNVYVHGRRHYWSLKKPFLTLDQKDLIFQDGPFSKKKHISCKSISDIQINLHQIRIETSNHDVFSIYPYIIRKEDFETLKRKLPTIISDNQGGCI